MQLKNRHTIKIKSGICDAAVAVIEFLSKSSYLLLTFDVLHQFHAQLIHEQCVRRTQMLLLRTPADWAEQSKQQQCDQLQKRLSPGHAGTFQQFLGLENTTAMIRKQRRRGIHEYAHKVVNDHRDVSVVHEARQFENLHCHVPALAGHKFTVACFTIFQGILQL